MSDQLHRSDPRVLNRRTLRRDHRRLAGLLRPGMTVLDAGCGTGAITVDIARAVGPEGHVLGIDRDESLLAMARKEHEDVPNLRFEQQDICSLDLEDQFDVATAARTLQWISEPGQAIERMKHATRAGGRIVVLDYTHEANAWAPDPPAAFVRFYDAFLAWRAANGWDNRMADHLPALFEAAGISDVETDPDDEVVRRGEPGFAAAGDIWQQVVEVVGPRVVAAGFLDEPDRVAAEATYRVYVQGDLQLQHLSLKTVRGRVA